MFALPRSFECVFRTLPDGPRLFYPRMRRGPEVLLRDAAQETVLRRTLETGNGAVLALLGFVLLLAQGASHSLLWQRLAQAAFLVTTLLGILGFVSLQWRKDQLLKGCPCIAERLTQRDYETCVASSLSVTHLKLRIAVVLLIAATCLVLGFDAGLHSDLSSTAPPVLFAAVLPFVLRSWLRFLKCKRTTG